MLNRCRLAVNSGRQSRGLPPLTDAQTKAIDDRIAATMRRMARTTDGWQAMSRDARVIAAANEAMADIAAEAARKVENAQRQALKTAEVEQRLTDAMGRQKKWSRARTLVEDMGATNAYIDGVKRDNLRHLMDLISAADNKQGANIGRKALMVLFDAQNPAMTRDLALEVFAKGQGNTGNAAAVKGAKAWLEVTEAMRERFNAGGGDVGRLEYGYLPQAHDQMRVLQAGAGKWADELLPLLDRSRYVKEDGARMSDAEVLDTLRSAWETVSSDGANKRAPGAFKGAGARANRGSQSREIHFKDGAAYLQYLRDYGTGSMYDAMIGHIGGLARDIGLVERYGPNPEAQMRLQFDLAERADGPRTSVVGQVAENLAGPQAQWNVLSGASGMSGRYARVAGISQHVRNVETFGKLQGAVLSSITDLATYFVTTGYNGLPYFQGLANIGLAMTKGTRDFLNAHAMIAESMASDLNRWAGENIAQTWSGRIANATMRLSLMNAWTDTLRRAFSLTMMAGTGKLAKTDWSKLTEWDRYRLARHNITEADWQVIRTAPPDRHRGADFITPDGIYATGDERAAEIVAKYIGMITDESEIAVLNPDLTTRAIVSGGGSQRGTVGGEFARHLSQFKSFPTAMISRHWRRIIDTPQDLQGAPAMANRLAYSGALMVSLTALGAIAFQSKQLVQGKDPVDMTTAKFWTRAASQGGGLGFYGDLLLGDTTDDMTPQQSLFRLLGPTADSGAQLWELAKGNIDEAIAGKNTRAGAESVRFLRGHLPLVNLWYGKAALDHAGLHALQENLSPGYLSRVKNKHRKDWRGEYWWPPGASFEEMSAPDMAAAVGR